GGGGGGPRGGGAGGGASGGADDEAALLHGARQALAERRVVVDDEQASVGLSQPLRGDRAACRAARVRGGVAHAVVSLLALSPASPARSRGTAWSGGCSRLARAQRMATWPPPSSRFAKASRAPVRSRRGCAMKMPSPMCPPASPSRPRSSRAER